MIFYHRIAEIAEKNNGYVTHSMVVKAGISPEYLRRMYKKETVTLLSRGVYLLSGFLEDEFFTYAIKYSRLAFSRKTALYLNNLSNRRIFRIEANVPYGYNNRSLKGLEIYRSNTIEYNLGLTYSVTPFGNKVRTYDMERCICDIFYYKDYEQEDAKYAITEYMKSGVNYDKLYDYAKQLNILDIVKTVFEVL